MHVSLQPRLASESNLRIAPRRRLAEDHEGGDLRRIFENPGDNRRPGNYPRRRPQNGRSRETDDQSAELRPSPMRPAPPAYAPPAKAAEFWSLLGAAAPGASGTEKPAAPPAKHVPTILELLDQVIASH